MSIWLAFLSCKGESSNSLVEYILEDIPNINMPSVESDDITQGWSLSDLEDQFRHQTSSGIPSGKPFFDAYFSLLGAGDDVCPGDPTRLTPDNVDGCVSSEGYSYFGLSVYLSIFDELEGQENPLLHPIDGSIIIGDFEMLNPEGKAFQAGGHISEFFWMEERQNYFLEGELQGSWMWEGSDITWVSSGISGLLKYDVLKEGPVTYTTLDGALQWGGQSMAFNQLKLSSKCEGFQGELMLRDPSGIWHTLFSEDMCSPCAQHWFGDVESTEQVCLDWHNMKEHFEGLLELPR